MFSPNQNQSTKYLKSQALLQEQSFLIESLEKQLESHYPNNINYQASLNLPSRPGPDKKSYAKDLLHQMSENYQRTLNHKLESQKPPFINGGFPNFPLTPDHLIKEKEKERKARFKHELEEQIQAKYSQMRLEKVQQLEIEKVTNQQLIKKLETETKEKIMRSHLENKILTESWDKANKAKWLKSQIEHLENFGVNPRSRSVLNKAEGAISSQIDSSEVKSSQDGLNRKASFYSMALKDKKQKNSYQVKIKKLVQEAKSLKQINSTSLSPSNFNSKKNFELRRKLIKKS